MLRGGTARKGTGHNRAVHKVFARTSLVEMAQSLKEVHNNRSEPNANNAICRGN